ncbi:MAG: polysaccharide biosynthesis/export family protein [Butyricimonas paravirosa]
MHVIKNVIMLVWAAGLFVSCASSKKVVYLQDVDVNKRIKAECEYKTVIHTDDLLSIIVSCDDLNLALTFNTPMIGLGREVNTTSSQQIPRGYLVDKNGEIDFPVLGKLKVGNFEKRVGGNVEREVVGILEESDRDESVPEFQGDGIRGGESSR